MRRAAYWLLVPALMAMAADEPTPNVTRGQRLRRDSQLIESVVQSGLRIAGENDPLKRATYCNGMAETLAAEISQAAGDRDGMRLTELGQYFQELLEQGVASNLNFARKQLPSGPSLERKLHPIGEQATEIAKRLEAQLELAPLSNSQDALRNAREQLRAGQTEVEKALRGNR
jgi:hypothetical protein